MNYNVFLIIVNFRNLNMKFFCNNQKTKRHKKMFQGFPKKLQVKYSIFIRLRALTVMLPLSADEHGGFH